MLMVDELAQRVRHGVADLAGRGSAAARSNQVGWTHPIVENVL